MWAFLHHAFDGVINIAITHFVSGIRVTTISMRHHHTGHILSEKYGGGTTVDNLRPICANGNLSMGTSNMADFVSKFGLHK